MSEQKINPELMLKAAEMAKPTEKWVIVGNCVAFDISTTSENYDQWRYFNPLHSDSDAFALERALKIAGWEFSCVFPDCVDECSFIAHMNALFSPVFKHQLVDKSDTLLLLKCVSAMTGIPVYRSDK